MGFFENGSKARRLGPAPPRARVVQLPANARKALTAARERPGHVGRAHLQYQNQQTSKAPSTSARKWKKAEVAKKEMMSEAKFIGLPFDSRKRPELGSDDVKFQPSDHLEMLLSNMNFVGMLRMR